uniref:hypothetical protein n=1 Tax=Trichocoleus desertorum TaxID=1481672 RepID=UPI0025B39674|nr:hypothetical protein [Trichocoleus desertorum]
MKRWSTILLPLVLLTAMEVVFKGSVAIGQTRYPACQPPKAEEYLLLVAGQAADKQAQLKRVLPATADLTVCDYQNQVVTRVSGFSSLGIANAWAQYLKETSGFDATVARPHEGQAAQAPTSPTSIVQPQPALPNSTSSNLAYSPRPLGPGYAVLVDYFEQPEIAIQVRQILSQNVGLVSYGQRPYLLAGYTTNQTTANATLQTLSDRGFWVMLVDSRRVVLLKPTVTLSAE